MGLNTCIFVVLSTKGISKGKQELFKEYCNWIFHITSVVFFVLAHVARSSAFEAAPYHGFWSISDFHLKFTDVNKGIGREHWYKPATVVRTTAKIPWGRRSHVSSLMAGSAAGVWSYGNSGVGQGWGGRGRDALKSHSIGSRSLSLVSVSVRPNPLCYLPNKSREKRGEARTWPSL